MHPLAPTDTESLDKVESKTPEIPENIYKKANFSIPSSVSSQEPNISWIEILEIICQKLPCKKIGIKNLYTYFSKTKIFTLTH